MNIYDYRISGRRKAVRKKITRPFTSCKKQRLGNMKVTGGKKETLRGFFKKHHLILLVLLGSLLVLVLVGPYTNWDANTEYSAATGVLK